jgi:hypothetical protein
MMIILIDEDDTGDDIVFLDRLSNYSIVFFFPLFFYHYTFVNITTSKAFSTLR